MRTGSGVLFAGLLGLLGLAADTAICAALAHVRGGGPGVWIDVSCWDAGQVVIVVDTGVLYALADYGDSHHQACTRWLEAVSDELIVPSLVITEAAYLIGSRGGPNAEALFLEALAPGGVFQIAELDPATDLPRIAASVV